MGIEVAGATELNGRLTRASGRIDPELRKALSKTGIEVKRKMKQVIPKKDGDAARAITMKSRGTKWRRSVVIGPETDKITPEPGDERGDAARRYPAYLEFGTVRMAPHPFMAASLEGAAERLTARLNDVIPKLL